MTWVWLSIAVIFEVIATMALKLSDGFTKLFPITIVIIGYCIAFIALSKVLQILPVALIYAIWSGLGITFLAIASWIWFEQKLTLIEIIGIGLIFLGIVIIRLFSKSNF